MDINTLYFINIFVLKVQELETFGVLKRMTPCLYLQNFVIDQQQTASLYQILLITISTICINILCFFKNFGFKPFNKNF